MVDEFPKEQCCGCGACLSACPVGCICMVEDGWGFLFPQIDHNRCIKCDRCADICPFVHAEHLRQRNEAPEFYALVHRSEDVLEKSSSGGALTTIIQAIETDEGKRPVVYGAAWDGVTKVRHIRVCDEVTTGFIRKSKYIQSKTDAIWKSVAEDLSKDYRTVFTGTPCQVAAALSLFPNEDNLVTVEVVCHGVAAPKAWLSYIRWQKDKRGEVSNVDFRFKKNGASYDSLLLEFGNGSSYKRPAHAYDDPFVEAYLRRLNCRDSCDICPFAGIPRVADFTIGDYWGAEKDGGCCCSSGHGVSLVMLNSLTARQYFDKMSKVAHISIADSAIATSNNGTLVSHGNRNRLKDDYMRTCLEDGFEVARKNYSQPRPLYKRIATRFFSGNAKAFIKKLLLK